MRFGIKLLLLASLLAFGLTDAIASKRSLHTMRKTFLQAEQYIKQDRETDFYALADTLKNYPLYPYLQYQWLVHHLDDAKSIQEFFHEFANSRYASLLHRKWMAHLGQQQQWPTFVNNYKNSNDTELQCYFAQAQYQSGQQQAALESAKQFWLSGNTQPASCDVLFERLQASPQFTPALVWQRFQAAIEQNNAGLAKQILPLLAKSDQAIADTWLKLHDQPQQVKQAASWKRSYPKAGLLFAHAIRRWLESDPQAALSVWDAQKQRFKIPQQVLADTEKRLGMALAFRHDKAAFARLSPFAGNDVSAQEWLIRAALSQQQWPKVLTAIAALDDVQKNSDKWQYWQAKALAATGQQQQAEDVFRNIANHRSYYAFLAADHLQQAIQLGNNPVAVSSQEIKALQHSNEFKVVNELLAIDRRPEAIRQWWHAIDGFDEHQLAVAAKLAQQWQWPSIAIFTIAKANHWDDIELRFPLQYNSQIQSDANRHDLDPAMVFALIRQESGFDEFAGSSAGAIGLMQVMPKTAKQIAGELNQNWSNDYNLLLPDVNIRYGSYYFKKMLDQFNGHFALATAAYNAGAYRIKQWLPKNQALPADIWIETIPYKETRGYVSSVVMYALIYQQLLNRNSLKVAELLQKVQPN